MTDSFVPTKRDTDLMESAQIWPEDSWRFNLPIFLFLYSKGNRGTEDFALEELQKMAEVADKFREIETPALVDEVAHMIHEQFYVTTDHDDENKSWESLSDWHRKAYHNGAIRIINHILKKETGE